MELEKKEEQEVTTKKKVEKTKEVKEDLFSIEEYCSLKNLDKYHLDFLKMSFGIIEKKTVKQWTELLLKDKLVKEKLIK